MITWPYSEESKHGEVSASIVAYGNPTGITFWAWEVRDAQGVYISQGTSGARWSSRRAVRSAVRRYRRNQR